MGGNKRKHRAVGCDCFKEHDSNIECEILSSLRTHREITAKIILFSEIVEVFVGKEKRAFSIHKDLLMIHSQYFTNLLQELEEDDMEHKIMIPNIGADLFLDFIAWLYTGEFAAVPNETFGGGARCDDLWAMGAFLKAPAFQNLCMDDCRKFSKDAGNTWPSLFGIEAMYSRTKTGSLLRKLAAHSMLHDNPLLSHPRGSKERKKWEVLTAKIPDLKDDMMQEAGRRWDGAKPWDDENRGEYMEDEELLEKIWDKHILRGKTKGDIQKEAKARDIRSMIELAHLNR